MARYRNALPQLKGDLFLTDGGIETTLIFLEGLDLPDFAAFDLLKRPEGETALRKYFRTYATLAKKFGTGLILEAATWRANPDWAARLGYSRDGLANANLKAIRLLERIRDEFEDGRTKVVISGCVGPRGDGYNPAFLMSETEAESYHGEQIGTFADSAADMITAITMNYVEEAVGVARAAKSAGMPVVDLFHRRNGWEAGDRPVAPGRDCHGRRGDLGLSRLLHDQLRPPDPLRVGADGGRAMAGADSGPADQRVAQEPRGAQRVSRAR